MTLKEHLEYRHINFDVHKPILSNPLVTFLLYNLSGQVVGYQRYNHTFPSAYPGDGRQNNLRDRRYYNYVTQGQIGVFGLETFTLNVPCVFITEGVFDAARLTKRGCCAFAMLTNNPSTSMRNFLMCLGKPIIAVCDNDPSGIKLRKAGHCFETVPAKDLGDAPEEYIDFLIGKYHEI